ncbi:MAG TPA: hypothetical protein PK079_00120 [Leptospiraceae bacterium]|nr:hypothetical protein [Leptospiraceae bacterium]HMW05155.1 hypothetical protein [Leptospiraceae bacterium]HMX32584.1 hypothetical protein [Leptospiraceae bacterium]HMY32494.1 hypothetical protein [Leptospiraceae bacterium]HMZ66957.1 hypothetical protein [Leptospiraceae bacterium]
MKFINAISILFLSSCSSLFWRDARLLPTLSFSENGKGIAYIQTHYQEKDSWNPLNGTSLKKNYTTQISLADIQNDLSLKKNTDLERFSFWILPQSLFYNEARGILAFIQGLDQNEYATPNKTVSIHNIKTKITTDLLKGKSEIKTPLAIALSSDASQIAIVSGEVNANGFYEKFQLFILDTMNQSIQASFSLPDWQDSPEYELGWLKSEATLSARVKSKLFTLKGKSISESNFSGSNLADNPKYAYARVYKWESKDLELERIKLEK